MVLVRGVHDTALRRVQLHGLVLCPHDLVLDPLEVAPVVDGLAVEALDGQVDQLRPALGLVLLAVDGRAAMSRRKSSRRRTRSAWSGCARRNGVQAACERRSRFIVDVRPMVVPPRLAAGLLEAVDRETQEAPLLETHEAPSPEDEVVEHLDAHERARRDEPPSQGDVLG